MINFEKDYKKYTEEGGKLTEDEFADSLLDGNNPLDDLKKKDQPIADSQPMMTSMPISSELDLNPSQEQQIAQAQSQNSMVSDATGTDGSMVSDSTGVNNLNLDSLINPSQGEYSGYGVQMPQQKIDVSNPNQSIKTPKLSTRFEMPNFQNPTERYLYPQQTAIEKLAGGYPLFNERQKLTNNKDVAKEKLGLDIKPVHNENIVNPPTQDIFQLQESEKLNTTDYQKPKDVKLEVITSGAFEGNNILGNTISKADELSQYQDWQSKKWGTILPDEKNGRPQFEVNDAGQQPIKELLGIKDPNAYDQRAATDKAMSPILQNAEVENKIRKEQEAEFGADYIKENGLLSRDELANARLQKSVADFQKQGYSPEDSLALANQAAAQTASNNNKLTQNYIGAIMDRGSYVNDMFEGKAKENAAFTDSEKSGWNKILTNYSQDFADYIRQQGDNKFGIPGDYNFELVAGSATGRRRILDDFFAWKKQNMADYSLVLKNRDEQLKMDINKAAEDKDPAKLQQLRAQRNDTTIAKLNQESALFQKLNADEISINKDFDVTEKRKMDAAQEYAGYQNGNIGDVLSYSTKAVSDGLAKVAADVITAPFALASPISKTTRQLNETVNSELQNPFNILQSGWSDEVKVYKDENTGKIYEERLGFVYDKDKNGQLSLNKDLSYKGTKGLTKVDQYNDFNIASAGATVVNMLGTMLMADNIAGVVKSGANSKLLGWAAKSALELGKENILTKSLYNAADAALSYNKTSALSWSYITARQNMQTAQEAGLTPAQSFAYTIFQSAATGLMTRVSPDDIFFKEYSAANKNIFRLLSQNKIEEAKLVGSDFVKKYAKSAFSENTQEFAEQGVQDFINNGFNYVAGKDKDGKDKFEMSGINDYFNIGEQTSSYTFLLDAINALGRGNIRTKGLNNLERAIVASQIPQAKEMLYDLSDQSLTGYTFDKANEMLTQIKEVEKYTKQIPDGVQLDVKQTADVIIGLQKAEALKSEIKNNGDSPVNGVLKMQLDEINTEINNTLQIGLENAKKNKYDLNAKTGDQLIKTEEQANDAPETTQPTQAPETTQGQGTEANNPVADQATEEKLDESNNLQNPISNETEKQETALEPEPVSEPATPGEQPDSTPDASRTAGEQEPIFENAEDELEYKTALSNIARLEKYQNEQNGTQSTNTTNDGNPEPGTGGVQQEEQPGANNPQTIPATTDSRGSEGNAEVDTKTKNEYKRPNRELNKTEQDWYDRFDKAKADGDRTEIVSLYDKLRVALNGITESEALKNLKEEIEAYGKSVSEQEQTPVQPTAPFNDNEQAQTLNENQYEINGRVYTQTPDGSFTAEDKNGKQRKVTNPKTIAGLNQLAEARTKGEVIDTKESNGYVWNKYANGSEEIISPKGSKIEPNGKNKKGKTVTNANFIKNKARIFGQKTDNEIKVEYEQRTKEALDNFYPTNASEAAKLYFANNGKVSSKSISEEVLGNSNKLQARGINPRKLTDYTWAYLGKGTQNSIEKVAEKLAVEYPHLDEQDIRNELIETVNSYPSATEIQEEIVDLYNKSTDPYFGFTDEDAIAMQEADASKAKMDFYNSVGDIYGLTDEELLDYYKQQYENSINSLTDEQQDQLYTADTRTESAQQADKNASNGNSISKKQSQEAKQKVNTNSPEYQQLLKNRTAQEERVKSAKEKFDRVNKTTNQNFQQDQENLFGERQTNGGMFDERADGNAGRTIIAEAKAEYDKERNELTRINNAIRDFENGKASGTGAIDFTEETQTPTATQKIEDFGEKIGGAKKDIYERLSEITTDDLESKPLSKSFPIPDFKKLVEDGVLTTEQSILLKFLYESIPAKPRKLYLIKSWAQKVKYVIDTYNELFSGNDIDVVGRLRESSVLGKQFKMYEEIHNEFGFPSDPANMGGYEIKRFTNAGGSYYAVVKGSYIKSKDLYSIKDAVNVVKSLVDKNKEEKKTIKFNIYQSRKTQKYFIGKKGANNTVNLIEFETLPEALTFLKDNQDQLENMWNAMKITQNERRDFNRARKGQDHRNGKNVTPEEFGNKFGFRGVEFGNWVNNDERQGSLNDAYDAFMDLALALGVQPRALSLNGELALAFGARGSGGKNPPSAHYEPNKIVINLTKKKGAGSLAHEWWHGLDNYFERTRGRKDNFLTDSPRVRINRDGTQQTEVRPAIIEAFKNIINTIEKSDLNKRSKEADKARSKAYFGTPIEMSARAFENFVADKLAESGIENDYLVNFKEQEEWLRGGNIGAETYPYPTKDEATDINKTFQQLFDTVEQRTTDNGNVILYQLAQNNFTPLTNEAFQKLIDRLKKAFPKFAKVTTNLEEAKAKATELGENITDLEMKTKDGNVYGFKLSDGTIYINPQYLNANTPIHEFSHLWEQLLPKAWAKGLEIFKQTKTGKDLHAKLKQEGNYANLTDEQLWSEAMNTHIGNIGEERYQNPRGKMAEFVDWFKNTMANFMNAIGIKNNWTKETKLSEFTNKTLGDILGEKELVAEGNTNQNNNLQANIAGNNGILINSDNKDEAISKLLEARRYEKEGKSRDEILLKTNWYKGADNKWRYVMNFNLSLKEGINDGNNKNLKLSEVIKYPQLFQYYPELKDMDVEFTDSKDIFPDNKTRAAYNPADNKIYINNGNNKTGDVRELRSSIGHEIQHAIQNIEGTESGTSYGREMERAKIIADKVRNGASVNSELSGRKQAFSKIYGENWEQKLRDGKLTEHDIAQLLYETNNGEIESRFTEYLLDSKNNESRLNDLLTLLNVTNERGINFSIIGNSLIPQKTVNEVLDTLDKEGQDAAFDKLKESSWYNNLSTNKKAELNAGNLVSSLIDSERRRNEAKNQKTTEKAAEKVKSAKEIIEQTINDAKEKKLFRGITSATVMANALKKLNKAVTPRQISNVINYVKKVIDNNNYDNDIREARSIQKGIKNLLKSKSITRSKVNLDTARDFLKINPNNVSDIDAYKRIASQIKDNLTGLQINKDFEFKNDTYKVSNKETVEYIDNQLKFQEKELENRLKEEYNNLVWTGTLPVEGMTYEQYKDMLNTNITDAEFKTEQDATKQEIKDQKLNFVKALVTAKVKHELPNYTEATTPLENKILQSLADIDLSKLDMKDLIKINDVINNILTNNNFVGSGDVAKIADYQKSLKAIEAFKKKTGLNMLSLGSKLHQKALQSLLSNDMVIEFITNSTKASAEVKRLLSIDALMAGNAKATIQHRATVNKYMKERSKVKNANTSENRLVRGIYSYMIQENGGTVDDLKYEFDRKKALVKESYIALKNSKDEENQREGEILEKIYNQLLEGSESIEDIETKLDKMPLGDFNKKAVGYWIREHNQYKTEFLEQGEIYNNTVAEDINNYTATRYKKIAGSKPDDADIELQKQIFTGNKLTEKASGSKTKRNKNLVLPANKVLNFDFDSVQADALHENLYDLHTTESIALLNQLFSNPESGIEALGGERNFALLKNVMRNTVMAQRKDVPFENDDLGKFINKALDSVAVKSIRMSLASVTQIPKQYISVMVNTMTNLSTDAALYFKALGISNNLELFNEANIGLRGTTTAGYTKENSILGDESVGFKTGLKLAAQKAGDAGKSIYEALMKPLEWSDVSVARTSWLAFYMQDLKKQGVDIDKINWENEHLKANGEAKAFADQKVSILQNANDASSMPDAFKNTNSWKRFVKNIALPFSSFSMNQRARMTSDARKLYYGSIDGRASAIKSLTATALEAATFNAFKTFVMGRATTLVAGGIIRALTNWDDDDKSNDYESKNWFWNTMSDIFFSGMGEATQKGLQIATNTIKKSLVGGEDVFYQYKPDEYKTGIPNWTSNFGMYGAFPTKIFEVLHQSQYLDKKHERVIKGGFDGKQVLKEVKMTDNQNNLARLSFAVDALSLAGVSDQFISQVNSKVKKRLDKSMNKRFGKQSNILIWSKPKAN